MSKAGLSALSMDFDHVAGFVVLVEGGIQIDCFAIAAIGPQLFTHAPGVVGDQGVGGFENAGSGAVNARRIVSASGKSVEYW